MRAKTTPASWARTPPSFVLGLPGKNPYFPPWHEHCFSPPLKSSEFHFPFLQRPLWMLCGPHWAAQYFLFLWNKPFWLLLTCSHMGAARWDAVSQETMLSLIGHLLPICLIHICGKHKLPTLERPIPEPPTVYPKLEKEKFSLITKLF